MTGQFRAVAVVNRATYDPEMAYSSTASIVIDAPRARVWEALTKPELVKRYFFDTEMTTDWNLNSPIVFRGEWQGKPYEDHGTVLNFEPQEAFSYSYWSSWSGHDDIPELRQIIQCRLSEEPGGIRVGIEQSNISTQELADQSTKNWNEALGGLKKLFEEEDRA